MSYADDMWHDVPPDDYPEGCSYPRKYTRSYINFGDMTATKHFKEVHAETAKAYLLEFDQGKAWVPKSQIRMFNPDDGKLMIPVWLSQSLTYIKDD